MLSNNDIFILFYANKMIENNKKDRAIKLLSKAFEYFKKLPKKNIKDELTCIDKSMLCLRDVFGWLVNIRETFKLLNIKSIQYESYLKKCKSSKEDIREILLAAKLYSHEDQYLNDIVIKLIATIDDWA